jgi:hypothetical protein
VSLHFERRLQDCERIAALRGQGPNPWALSRLTDDELDELIALQTRVGEPEDPSVLSAPELGRFRELWAGCLITGEAS